MDLRLITVVLKDVSTIFKYFFTSKNCYEGQNNGSFYCSTFLDFAPKGLKFVIFVILILAHSL